MALSNTSSGEFPLLNIEFAHDVTKVEGTIEDAYILLPEEYMKKVNEMITYLTMSGGTTFSAIIRALDDMLVKHGFCVASATLITNGADGEISFSYTNYTLFTNPFGHMPPEMQRRYLEL